MTPPQAVRDYRHEFRAVEPVTREPTLKWETAKYLGGMLLAGLVSYYATMYGLREEVAILKVRIEYLSKAVDSQSATINRLTDAINAHSQAHEPVAARRR
jgi:hypothetical protein